MIDELELLKKDWKKKEAELPQLSQTEINKMIGGKSRSIVKWILIISLLEFTLPHLLYLLPGMENSVDIYRKLGMTTVAKLFMIGGYTITIYFIYQFYRRYRAISILDDAKSLMEKIIKAWKTVKYYIIYNLSFMIIFCLMFLIAVYLNGDIMDVFPPGTEKANIPPEAYKNSVLLFLALAFSAMIVGVGTLYLLLYGLLLRKLKRNYRELKKLEV